MKKLSLLMALCLLMTMVSVPALAHIGYSYSDDFSSYTSEDQITLPNTWRSSSVHAEKDVAPVTSSGGGLPEGATTIKGYVTIEPAVVDEEHGTSIKYSTNYNNYSEMQKSFDPKLRGLVEIGFSMYAKDSLCNRVVYLYGDGATYEYVLCNFNYKYYNLVLNFNGTEHALDKFNEWYDFKFLIDIETKNTNLKVYNKGKVIYETSAVIPFTGTNIKALSFGTRLNYWQEQGRFDSTIYLDDIYVNSVNRVYDYEREYNFETFKEVDHPYLTGLGKIYEAEEKNDIFRFLHSEVGSIETVETERGKSLKMTQNVAAADSHRFVKEGFVRKNWNGNDITATSVFDLQSGMPIEDVVNIAISLKYEDFERRTSFGIPAQTNGFFQIVQNVGQNFTQLSFLGEKVDLSELKIEKDKWYDFKVGYDFNNKYASIEVYNNGKLLYSKIKAATLTDTAFSSLGFGCLDNDKGSSTAETTTFYVDDLKIGEGEPIFLPADTNYDTFDIAYSSPMTARKVAVGTPLSVTFNNTIDKATFTADTVKVYENGAPIDAEISFADDGYTVLLGADLDYGKYYDVVFTGVSDGTNTLSDYIEFSTYAAPFVFGETAVSGDSASKTLTTTVSSGDGFSHKVSYISALYEGNRLVSVKYETADIYPNHPLEVSAALAMPSAPNGEEIKVKGMLWNAGSMEAIKEAFEYTVEN